MYVSRLSSSDRALAAASLKGFVPRHVYDVHAHTFDPSHYPQDGWRHLANAGVLGRETHQRDLKRYMGCKTLEGLYFPLPDKNANQAAANAKAAAEARSSRLARNRALALVRPRDNPEAVSARLGSGEVIGLKPYHCYADRAHTMNAAIDEFAPEWMWDVLNEVRGVLMLHIVRDSAIADEENQKQLRYLCRRYPNVRLILAHIGRSFNYRNARQGLYCIADLENVFVDSSAICEAASFDVAFELLGPKRVMFGSDYPVSELRGRCATVGNQFIWLHPENFAAEHAKEVEQTLGLVGIESLLCLREACEDQGFTSSDLEDVFRRNAERILNLI